jgi:hypothetical protein
MVGEQQSSPGFARTLEDLWVWQQARQMVADVYRDFGQGTSAERNYAYRRQLQSDAVFGDEQHCRGVRTKIER